MADWVMVVVTTIYMIATIVICIFNGKSAKAANEQSEIAKKQIQEMVRQYNNVNRPQVNIRFEVIRSGLLVFVVENIGPLAAYNVNIHINDEFIDNIEKEDRQIRMKETNNCNMFLSSRQKIYFILGGQMQFNNIARETAHIDITYNAQNGDGYNEKTDINLNDYRYLLVYSSEIEDISQHLKKIEEENKRFYRDLLKNISKNGAQNVYVSMDDGSKKFEVFKTVCTNDGFNAEQISEYVWESKENVLDILYELYKVDRLIEPGFSLEDDDYKVQWYRK